MKLRLFPGHNEDCSETCCVPSFNFFCLFILLFSFGIWVDATLIALRSAYITKARLCVFSQLTNSTDGNSIGIRISGGALLSQKSACFSEIRINYGSNTVSAELYFGPLFCFDFDRQRKGIKFEMVFYQTIRNVFVLQ